MTMPVGCWVLLVMAWGAVNASEGPPNEARQWLARMVKANQTLDYDGVVIHVQGAHLEALRIIHTVEADGERQHIVSLSGPQREVVVTHNRVICLLPEQQNAAVSAPLSNPPHAPAPATDATVASATPPTAAEPAVTSHQLPQQPAGTVEHPSQQSAEKRCSGARYSRSSFPVTGPRDLARLEQHYTFAVLGTDRVADQETVIIAIQPRDRLRFGYHLWLDRTTGILLRSTLLDEAERIVEQVMFTQFAVTGQPKPPLPPVTQATSESTTAQALTPLVSAQSGPTWHVVQLPAGFEQIMHNRFSIAGQHPTDHMIFSDGLVMLSVFLERLAGAQPLLVGPAQLGAMNAFGAVIADHQVVVVGEVPQTTAQSIVKSLIYKSE